MREQTDILSIPWDRVAGDAEPLSFKKSQVLFYEEHHPYGVFLLKSGEVEFRKKGSGCNENHFLDFTCGKVIGAKAFLENQAYECTCVAQSHCKVLFISKSQLLSFIQK